jgi:hypothetical protein
VKTRLHKLPDMKNIHLIPTDNPSRLRYNLSNNLVLTKESYKDYGKKVNQNIYITSDEEIEEEDWVAFTNLKNWVPVQYLHGDLIGSEKKIILTTDEDLIADGVQAIDDEFLEWFVKNTSCGEVDISTYHVKGDISGKLHYKITIPQEEPKQVLGVDFQMSIDDNGLCVKVPIPKQETLEETEIVPYQQSLALKELGFDKPCFGAYGAWGFMSSNDVNSLSDEVTQKDLDDKGYNEEDGVCLAPTFSQAFRWFRKKYKLFTSEVYDRGLDNGKLPIVHSYSFRIFNLNNFEDLYSNTFKTYEEAELALSLIHI